MAREIDRLRELKQWILGWPRQGSRLEKYRQNRKYTARERVNLLLDSGSFREVAMLSGSNKGLPAEGCVSGWGTIEGRSVCCFASDSMVLGGSIGELHGLKIYECIERALQMGVPCIGLWDAPGGRVLKLDELEAGGSDLCMQGNERGGHCAYYPVTQASGKVPQISVIMGDCAGNAVYTSALTDFVFMVDKTSHMFVTGPRVLKSVMGENISKEELGGADVHARVTGLCDFRGTEDECLQMARNILSFLPANCDELPPSAESREPKADPELLNSVLPDDTRVPYDVRRVIEYFVDDSQFVEMKREFAGEMCTGFSRLSGQPIGVIANNPMVRAGSMTAEGSRKQARFIRFCDCFNIPIVLLVDTPAYLPGKESEQSGIIHHGCKVVYALCEATVPRIVVLLRKIYGGSTLGMGFSPGLGTDFVFSWPTGQVGIMGAGESVNLLYRKELEEAEKPEELRQQLVERYEARYNNPFGMASETTHLDDVIEPKQTRWHLIEALKLMKNKQVIHYNRLKKHGNIPL